jgi:hypothetical protein
MGLIVIFEIYRLALEAFPGTARMARNLLGAAFLGIFVKTLVTMHVDSPGWIKQTYVRLERDLRLVQSVAIIILVVMFLWYAIPLGRNLGAILAGYGTFVGLSVIQLTIVSHYESRAHHFWSIAQPVIYTTALGIWTLRLWSSDRVLEKSYRRGSECDYEELASATSRALKEARARLGSAVRP